MIQIGALILNPKQPVDLSRLPLFAEGKYVSMHPNTSNDPEYHTKVLADLESILEEMAKRRGYTFGFGSSTEDPETGESKGAFYGTTWPLHYTKRQDLNAKRLKLFTYLSNRYGRVPAKSTSKDVN